MATRSTTICGWADHVTDDATTRRIALAWRQLRRGAPAATLRARLLGPDGPALDQHQLDALEILAGEPGWRMSEYADALRVEPSTATRSVQRLEQFGLAERSSADDDRRVVIARATLLGRRTAARAAQLRASGMCQLLESFDEHEQVEFADYLDRFVAAIDRLVTELDDAV